jgi:Viral BACON domain
VHFVYAVPQDKQARADDAAAIAEAALDFQAWLQGRMPAGQTFRVADPLPQVVTTPHVSSWYATESPDTGAFRFWFAALNDTLAAVGGVAPDPMYIWIIYPTTAVLTVSAAVALSSAQYRALATNIAGSVTSNAATLLISGLPSMVLDKTTLSFGAIPMPLPLNLPTTLNPKTPAQVVRMTQIGQGTVTWTATSTEPWLTVSPVSGTGPADLLIDVRAASAFPTSGAGAIELSFMGAQIRSAKITVTLNILNILTSQKPFGVIDTPSNNATGVTGAIPMTGWALDDIQVFDVTICRAAVTSEVALVDARCGGAAQIFVGSAVFIDGARPDVQAAYPMYPRSSSAGWGFMVLTNMLPNQGNGPFVFFVYARDVDGHVVLLGTRTLTCANAQATAPFGTIDTPGQGDTVSGSQYVNFGWALTQNPKFIPFDGSTLQVYVDGVAVGSPSYNHYRSDIATIFPGLANSDGAVGFKILDTTSCRTGCTRSCGRRRTARGARRGSGAGSSACRTA